MTDQTQLIHRIQSLAEASNRIIIAITGPPASGKSTFVDELICSLEDAVIVPMDGFHLDNVILEKRELLSRKGSPETFDASGYHDLLWRTKNASDTVYAPMFDREADLSRAAAIEVPRCAKIILAEGNYLLLDQSPWRQLQPLFDMTVSLSVPIAILKKRLIQRWLDHGLSPDQALLRAESNDLPNARLVVDHSMAADSVINNY